MRLIVAVLALTAMMTCAYAQSDVRLTPRPKVQPSKTMAPAPEGRKFDATSHGDLNSRRPRKNFEMHGGRTRGESGMFKRKEKE